MGKRSVRPDRLLCCGPFRLEQRGHECGGSGVLKELLQLATQLSVEAAWHLRLWRERNPTRNALRRLRRYAKCALCSGNGMRQGLSASRSRRGVGCALAADIRQSVYKRCPISSLCNSTVAAAMAKFPSIIAELFDVLGSRNIGVVVAGWCESTPFVRRRSSRKRSVTLSSSERPAQSPTVFRPRSSAEHPSVLGHLAG